MSAKSLSCVQLFETLWTIARQAPVRGIHSPGKSTAVGSHFLLQGTFLTQGLDPQLFLSPASGGGFFTTSATWEATESKT